MDTILGINICMIKQKKQENSSYKTDNSCLQKGKRSASWIVDNLFHELTVTCYSNSLSYTFIL